MYYRLEPVKIVAQDVNKRLRIVIDNNFLLISRFISLGQLSI